MTSVETIQTGKNNGPIYMHMRNRKHLNLTNKQWPLKNRLLTMYCFLYIFLIILCYLYLLVVVSNQESINQFLFFLLFQLLLYVTYIMIQWYYTTCSERSTLAISTDYIVYLLITRYVLFIDMIDTADSFPPWLPFYVNWGRNYISMHTWCYGFHKFCVQPFWKCVYLVDLNLYSNVVTLFTIRCV